MGDNGYFKIGPAGIATGCFWEEKGRINLVRIFLSHSNETIKSIQFQYAENGNLVTSKIHGTHNGRNFDAVNLDFPNEYITKISGYTRTDKYGYDILCSLTFGTNRREYGPFGQFTGNIKPFCFNPGDHRWFGGFHGTDNIHGVQSIGIYHKAIMKLDDDRVSMNSVGKTKKELE